MNNEWQSRLVTFNPGGGSRVSRLALAIVSLLFGSFPSAQVQQNASSERPNVVLIVADDLGYGDLSSYGAPDIRTPNLDKLAHAGIRFTDFYANASVCTPTRAALMTGRYQQRVLLEHQLSVSAADADKGLPANGNSLPAMLKRNGYATGLIGKWHLGFKPEFHPNRHGFDYFWGFLAAFIDWYAHVRGDRVPDLYENATPVKHEGYLGHEVTKRSIDFIDRRKARPFFLEITYGAPHGPIQLPSRPSVSTGRGNQMVASPIDGNPPSRANYVEVVEDLDRDIGRVMDALDRAGVAQNTLVIFTSDNGGDWLSRNAPFSYQKGTIWEGGIRVPTILRWPAKLPSARVSSQVAITMDLTATILSGTATPLPADLSLDGIDLTPLITRRSGKELERTLFWRTIGASRNQRAVRRGDWKLLVNGGELMLFDVKNDPAERTDRAARHPQRVRDLEALFTTWQKDVDGEAKKWAQQQNR
jgi:arylsulfatase A-like enzyme